ncbi:MAG TPA: AI-2E family transporter [Cyclobacteriaceae bacterium]|nr:AI-2E family transporter [Cyclobacteriaceae bacterium]
MEHSGFLNGNIKIERVASWLFVIGIIVLCLIYFSNFLQPLVLGVMAWYLIYVFKEYMRRVRIRKKQLPEWLLTILAFVFIFLVTYGIVEMVSHNLELILSRAPTYIENSRPMLESIKTIEGFEAVKQRLIDKVGDFDLRPIVTGLLNGISSFAGNILLIIIYVGFLLAEQKFFRRKLKIVLQDSKQGPEYIVILREVNNAVQKYVLVKTQISLLTGVLSYFILLAFRVDFPILWAFLIFLFNYIPYVGSLIATLLPALFAVFQFQSFIIFVWVFLAIEVVQIMVGNVLEPKVMGRTLNLSPLGVLLALAFWGIIWGILGMIISVPITSILVIIASRIPNLRFVAVWLSETGDLYKSEV